MATGCNGSLFWGGITETVGSDIQNRVAMTDAQLDYWDDLGVSGWIMSMQRLYGLGGARTRFDTQANMDKVSSTSTTFAATSVTFGGGVVLTTVVAGDMVSVGTTYGLVTGKSGQQVNVAAWKNRFTAAVTVTPTNAASTQISGAEYEFQRSLRYTDFGTRAAARGMKFYLGNYATDYRNGSQPRFFADWFDDTRWDTVVLPALEKMSAASALYGGVGVVFDCENYPSDNPAVRPSWSWTAQGGSAQGEVATRAKARARGVQMMEAMVDGYGTGIEVGAYFVYFPESLGQAVQNTVGGTNYSSWVQNDLVAGWASVAGCDSITIGDASFYKDTGGVGNPGNNTAPNATGWNVALQYGSNTFYAYISRYFPSYDPDKIHYTPFSWVELGEDSPQGWSAARSPAYVAVQLAAFERWGAGPEWWNYASHHFGGPATFSPVTFAANDFNYEPYLTAFEDATASSTVDSAAPGLTVTSQLVVGSVKTITGTATDDFAVRSVRWVNNTTAASGVARMTWVVISGDNSVGRVWRMDWTCDVPISAPSNSITITAKDIHGLTATADGTPVANAPIVVANAASAITQTTVTLSGTVDPETLATDGRFEYGTTASYGTQAPVVAMGSGTSPVVISQNITGLVAGTLYHFRLTATNSASTSVTQDGTFTTSAVPAFGAPIVTVNAAASIGTTTVTLSGTVDPEALATDGRFDYGTTLAYGTQTSAVAMGTGSTAVALSQNVTGLTAGTLYHFRITATNSAGTTVSADGTFTTTAAPVGEDYGPTILATSGLSSYWRLGEPSGTVAADSKGASPGTYVNTPTLAVAGAIVGDADTAVTFASASSEHVIIANDVPLRPGTGPFSLEFWIKRNGNPAGSEFIYEMGDPTFGSPSAGGHTIHIASSGLIAIKAAATVLTSTVGVCDNAWHHVVFSCPRTGSFTCYIDGVARGTATANATNLNGGGAVDVYWARRGAGNYFNGSLDEAAYYTAALSEATVNAHLDAAGGGVAAPPVNTVAPEVTGLEGEGQLLTCSIGVWNPAGTSYAFQWERNGVDISGETSATHTQTSADINQPMSCTVTATNADGSTAAESNVFNPFVLPVNSGLPSVTGTAETGHFLACTTGLWANLPSLFGYQWRRNGADIAGATASSYLLAVADEGTSVLCRVTATNVDGPATADSNAVSPVSGAPPPVPTRFRSLDFAADTVVSIAAPKSTVAFTTRVLTAAITPHVLRSDDG